jgi:hypothetical protein
LNPPLIFHGSKALVRQSGQQLFAVGVDE